MTQLELCDWESMYRTTHLLYWQVFLVSSQRSTFLFVSCFPKESVSVYAPIVSRPIPSSEKSPSLPNSSVLKFVFGEMSYATYMLPGGFAPRRPNRTVTMDSLVVVLYRALRCPSMQGHFELMLRDRRTS